LLTTAVTLRLRSDVPLGVFLSGGIDSSLVAAIAARHAGRSLHTFSIGFAEPAYDESAQAEGVARHLGTEHRTFAGRAELFAMLPDTVRHFGEPFGDATALAMRLLAEQTRQHVTVALSGDGGDEAFGGYEWYGTARRLRGLGTVVRRPAARLGLRLAPPRFPRVRRGLALLAVSEAERYGALRTFLRCEERRALYAGDLVKYCGGCEDGFPAGRWIAELYEKTHGTPLRRMRVVDFQTYLADCLMPKVDVPTMAYGLEARAPLLDQELVEFALTLPDSWLEHPQGGKRILRALLERYLPAPLMAQRKRGFSVPLQRWLGRQLGAGPVDSLANDEALLDTGWFNRGAIQGMVHEHVQGQRDHSQRIYNLLVLREWVRSC
jgi:asparagine synthase (glutamine-hydrolysing)